MKQISALVKAHPYLTTYLFVYALLQIGLLNHSGLTYAPALFFLFLLPLFTGLLDLFTHFLFFCLSAAELQIGDVLSTGSTVVGVIRKKVIGI